MKNETSLITITPDPQILHVLTYLEMRPIDSLCELIDNSIDAIVGDDPNNIAGIYVDLPTRKEVEDGTAVVRIRDSGPGMTLAQVESSLRAGYSSKAKLGSLGLFGVGFNIATGKLGRKTRLVTARADDDFAIEAIVDLVSLKKSGNFSVEAKKIPKQSGFGHGTLVEVSAPWGPAVQNYGFMLKLVSMGRAKTLAQLGRVYSTILRGRKLKILVGVDTVEPFYHCVWDDIRYVEHQKHGKISAIQRFDNKVIHTARKCLECGTPLTSGEIACPEIACGSTSTILHEERISGWVGIQRYLDASHYGIDLIRGGRAIRILEKSAFFEFQDPETGDPTVDYPIDNREGRIVGEIHLNHVPVDPAKQNFERSSPEWRRAMEFLRGASSLQPEKPGADANNSPIFKLYQGYRKVRSPGRRSMTMGKWLPGANEATSLTRLEIEEIKRKFEAHEVGYFTDVECWKLVEQADSKPVVGLRKCPSCFLESPDGLDECPHCTHLYSGKVCIAKTCGELISKAAVMCPHCGANQIPTITAPWICEVCANHNSSDDVACGVCSNLRGTPSPVSLLGLEGSSQLDEGLSRRGVSITLANGAQSSPVDVAVLLSETPIYVYHSDGEKIELSTVKFTGDQIKIFVNLQHPLFAQADVALPQLISFEIASYIYEYHRNVTSSFPAEHSVSQITSEVLKRYWPERFSVASLTVERALDSLFDSIRSRLAHATVFESLDIYSNLSQDEKTQLALNLVKAGRDISELGILKGNGQFIYFLRPRGLIEVFRLNPKVFFDGNVWAITYSSIATDYPEIADGLQAQIRGVQGSLLEIAVVYFEKGAGDRLEAEMVISACKLLAAKLAD